jgi:hypothetical protein
MGLSATEQLQVLPTLANFSGSPAFLNA